MVLTIIVILIALVLVAGFLALYREIGMGLDGEAKSTAARPSEPAWPLANVRAGNHFAVPSDEPYTGFLALVADDDNALAGLYSAAAVAEDWGFPLLVAIAKTFQPNGWIDHLDSLPGDVGQYDMRVDEMRALGPAYLPILAFINESRILEASTALDSPATIATRFQRCRFGLRR